ncbi:rna polymerase i-specific transcription-initiation factor rrn6 [Fusarium langsethiae]|uniref:Rna polymerase i-specific transcription-initiation factor rrn6 n=1 Tax=Fusarium langsethiae TaxID=179993 RepID=A0A0M9F407_FUSLA|nr:rna polymerase i-specific transcription-initiation factor rrn6 [Fusarium langsethiae]GKU17398.1 unnamed protein product [Fusarium langsethiae]
MAETRRLTDLIHGHVGSLTYLPPEKATTQVGTFHTSRITSEAPHFKVIGSSAELYPPSKSPSPEVSSNLWQERRIQKRWLLQAHPEAFMGNPAVSTLLEENMNRYSRVEGEISDRPLLSIGQMTNVSDQWRVAGAPMLAAATGESGELLRLARIDQSKWQWGADKHTTLQPSVIDPDDPEEEAIWASDGLPISQVKFATSMSRYDAVRWLIVQKQTSTTILNPEYHKIPVAQSSTADINIQHPRLSRIDPNPILTISHKMTGGNAHIDVAFNANSKGQSPQIAIIDECGYWSIWDTLGGRPKARLSSYKFGHLSDGLLNEIPSTTEHKAEKHGIIFVGTTEVDNFWEDESQSADESGESAKRSSHLLIWNREKYEVIDLESHIALPQLSLLARPKSKPDAILDIRISPANQNHIFVLTMRALYWIDLFATRREEDSSSPKPTILISCPRLLDREALRMTTCLTSEGGQQAAMVFVFSPTHRQLQIYWFGHSKENGLPYWHRDVLSLPNESNAIQGDIQSLEIHPAKLAQDGKPSSGPGADYYRAGVQFYQGSILTKGLGVQYCICVSVKDRSMQITLPTGRLVRSKTDQTQRFKKKCKQFLRHMGNAFVLPDGMAENINEVVKRHGRSAEKDVMKNRVSEVFGPMHLKLDLMCRHLQQTLVSISESVHDIPPALLYAIQENIAEGMAEGRLSLKTWKEIDDQTGSMDLASYNTAEQPDILDLFLGDGGQTVVTQLGRQTSEEWIRELVSLSHLNQTYVDLWLDPIEGRLPEEEEEIRRGWIADLAKDMFLATAGVMVQDMPLLGTASQGGDDRAQPTQSSATRIRPSQTSDGDIPSSPPSTTSNITSDAAIRRLQLLAPSLQLDKMETAKQSSVLSRWPTERGATTDDYISSVAIASDRKFEDARLRLQRMENKRKAHAEKYRLPPTMRQGGESTPKAKKSQIRTGGLGAPPRSSQMRPQREDPVELPPMPAPPTPAQFLSSQQGMPTSSQSQGMFGPSIAMSQPVSGIFGDRKKAKKPKRKSEFR